MTQHAGPRRRKRGRLSVRALAAAIGTLVLALTVAACGSSSSSSTSSASASSAAGSSTSASSPSSSGGVAAAQAQLQPYKANPTTITITTPLKSAPPKGKKLVMLATTDPNNVKLQNSLKSLAASVGWSYDQVSYDPANPATFSAAVDTAITKKANYIAEAGIPLTPALVNKVKQAGAKWVLTAVYPVNVTDPVIVDANGYQSDDLMGKVLADFFISDSNAKGNAIIEHVPAYPILGGFTDGFQAEVKKNCPGCTVKIINITIPDLAAGKVPSIMVSALRSNPNANYMGFDVGPFATGINSALAAAGLGNKVKIIGEAADEGAIAALKSGQQTAWTGFSPIYSTYVMMDAMLRDAEGMPINVQQSAVQPTQILTHDNVNSAVGSSTSWNQPTNGLDQFKKLWQVQ
ncbi:MAG TPA: substrate-binding domain-containing protein [Solirubrobacteraceae bacterium]|nr:substrate-binding domain-containing protein [Solirubrobacteraceae bacterium]